MDHDELGVAMAVVHLAGRRRQAVDSAGGGRAARAVVAGDPGRAAEEGAMLVGHEHEPGVFDAGHCRACARQRAIVALWSSGAAILLAAIALLTG
jgi:hypothetical protein